MAAAAAHTVVQVGEVVEAGRIDPEVVVTPGIFIDTVVTVPVPIPDPAEKGAGQ
jgi:3-oxoadipate CoA-transferase alpha subunit